MPKKPTEPFGVIEFGKDGSVRKLSGSLSNVKSSQEAEIGQSFAKGLALVKGEVFDVQMCQENDHDFVLTTNNQMIIVQATEIVSRDYLCPIDFDDYINGRHSFTSLVYRGPKEMLGVDTEAKEIVLQRRIIKKLDKNYSKPTTSPLWLLVWTVCSDYHLYWYEGNTLRISSSVTKVREYLSKNGAGPFDEIWFLSHNVETAFFRPNQIWPSLE